MTNTLLTKINLKILCNLEPSNSSNEKEKGDFVTNILAQQRILPCLFYHILNTVIPSCPQLQAMSSQEP